MPGASQVELELQRVEVLLALQGDELKEALKAPLLPDQPGPLVMGVDDRCRLMAVFVTACG